MNRGKLLILKRKKDDDTYAGFWDCVGGHFQEGESAEECMLREAKEESGQVMKIIRSGPLVEYLDAYGRAVAIPYLLRPEPNGKIRLSEHSEYRWISPEETKNYEIVPDLIKALGLFGIVRRSPSAQRRRTK